MRVEGLWVRVYGLGFGGWKVGVRIESREFGVERSTLGLRVIQKKKKVYRRWRGRWRRAWSRAWMRVQGLGSRVESVGFRA